MCSFIRRHEKFEHDNDFLYRVRKFHLVGENVGEEIIVNIECSIDRNPRFINRKAKSYGIILRCGIISRLSREGVKGVKRIMVDI